MAFNTNMFALAPREQIESPQNSLAKVLQLQQAQQTGELNTMKLDAERRGVADDAQMRDWTTQAGGDMNKLRTLAYGGGNYKQGAAIDKTIAEQSKATREAEKAKLEGHLQKFDVAARIMSGVKDQASWDAARELSAQAFGPEAAAQMPASYDPALIEQKRMQAMSVKEQIEAKFKALDFTEKQENNQRVDARAGATLAETKANNLRVDSRAYATLNETKANNGRVDARSAATLAQGGKPPPGYRFTSDGNLQAIPGGPADLKINAEGQKKTTEAKDVLGLLDEVDALLPGSTGSYAGAGVDKLAGAVGYGTKGAQATSQLKALEGALISKMPKMSGPQSDKDVLLYKQMAGQVGDQTIPVSQRQAASGMIRKLNEKYAGMAEGSSQKGGAFGDAAKEARFQAWKATQ